MTPSCPMSAADRGVPLHVDLPLEVRSALQDQEIDILDLLLDQGFDVKRGAAAHPMALPGTKDAALVILASGASLYMIGLAIVQIIRTLCGRPVIGELGPIEPLVDSQGHIVRDSHGEPITYRVGEKQILSVESRPRDSATTISIPHMLEVRIKD